MQKQTQTQLQQLPKLIMAVTLIVMLGALFGAVGWLMNHPAIIPPSNSEKVYTIDEVLKTFDTNPESLKDKNILLRAYVVDGIMGIGCEDFYILTDYGNVNFYLDYIKRYTEGKTTAEEKIKFDSIPRLEAAVRTVIPGGISEYAIFIGHFYDEWQIKNCNNSWTRFAITGKKETLTLPVDDIVIATDKMEYEQGEKITATLSYKDKIYQWDKYAWSIQKLEDNAWVTIQRRDDPYFFCANTSECKNEKSIEEIKECLPVVLCEMPMWYEIKDMPKLVWDQAYKFKEKNFSCEIPAHLGEARRLNDRNCAIFDQVPAGKYKIRFEYAVSINPDDLFSREVDIRYTEKEFTIKEKIELDPRCSQRVRITGTCEGKLIDDIGYQFNSEIGKCVEKVVGGTGCRIETPFNSLEECQKVCEEPQVDFYSCVQDSDCIKVKNGCCGCNAGGKSTSINKNYEREWKDKLSKECRDMDCPMVMSNNPSCFAEPKCENGKCVLAKSEDVCDVGNGIFKGDNPNLSAVKSKCEQKSECKWRPLGGKAVSHFACCPKDLTSITDENRGLYGRCFIMID